MRILPRVLRFTMAEDGHSAVEHAAVIAFVVTLLVVGAQSAGDFVQVFKSTADSLAATSTDKAGTRSTSKRRTADDKDPSDPPTTQIAERREALRIAAARARRRTEFQATDSVPTDSSNAPAARFAEHHRPGVDPIR